MHVAGLGVSCVGLVNDVVLAKQRKFPDSPLLLNPGLFFSGRLLFNLGPKMIIKFAFSLFEQDCL